MLRRHEVDHGRGACRGFEDGLEDQALGLVATGDRADLAFGGDQPAPVGFGSQQGCKYRPRVDPGDTPPVDRPRAVHERDRPCVADDGVILDSSGHGSFLHVGCGRTGAQDCSAFSRPSGKTVVVVMRNGVGPARQTSRPHSGPWGQPRGLSTSSGTDSPLITPNDVASGGVTAFRASQPGPSSGSLTWRTGGRPS